ncbi:MAG: hypothetical protein J5772_02755 [Clostridia bacterium]|nr:hypothetical protein [Clostridia bacterium]
MLAFFAVLLASLAAFAAVPKRIDFSLGIRGVGADLRATLYLLFGALPISFELSMRFSLKEGFVLYFGGKRRKLPKSNGTKGRTALLKAVKLKRISASGKVGIKDAPDKSALVSGALTAVISCAAAALTESRQEISITPSFERPAFSIDLDGILYLNAGKLIIEEIKLRRKKANESSHRKHHAFVDGAY